MSELLGSTKLLIYQKKIQLLLQKSLIIQLKYRQWYRMTMRYNITEVKIQWVS